jgi:hypothetical protein
MMRTGLWQLGASKDVENTGTSKRIPSASLSADRNGPRASLKDAKNIQVVIMEFKRPFEHGSYAPFTTFAKVTYHSNYFLLPFQNLKRVAMVLPSPYLDGRGRRRREDCEMIYSNGIRLANNKLGVPGKLSRVSELHLEVGHWGHEDEERARDLREEWFWQADEGSFLKPVTPPVKWKDRLTSREAP